MNMTSLWQRIRWLFMAFQDSLRYHLSLTGRPSSLIAQFFLISFLEVFGSIFSVLIFSYLTVKGLIFQYPGFDSIQWAYSLGLWIIFFTLSRFMLHRIQLGWLLAVDGFFRLNRNTSLKSAFSEAKEYRKFWTSARKTASLAPKGVQRKFIAYVEFYRLLIGYGEASTMSWYSESIHNSYVEMKQRICGRRNSIFCVSIVLLLWYVIITFFPMLGMFQEIPLQIVNSSTFNATNMLALSSCLSAVYALFETRQLGPQQVNLQTYCLRIAEGNMRAAEEHRSAILSLDRHTRYSLAGTLQGPLAMDFYLLLFPITLGLAFYFFSDFFAQLFTVMLLFLLPNICRNIDQSRLFLKIRIVGQEKIVNTNSLIKLAFMILELFFIAFIVSFLIPYFTVIPLLNNPISFYFGSDLRFIMPITIFLVAILFLGWSKNAAINQRTAHEYSFVLLMFTAGLGFAVLKGYFLSFIYSLPALGLVCLRLLTKMRRGC